MTSVWRPFAIFLTLLAAVTEAAAQYQFGPYTIVVNKQTAQASTYSGQQGYTADHYESGSGVYTVTGPIKVTVTPALSIARDESKTWSGTITADPAQIAAWPEPGQSVPASIDATFSITYYDYYGPGQNRTVPKTGKLTFELKGIKVDVPEKTLVCSNGQHQITANGYPAGGTYQWKTTSANIVLTNANQQTVTIQAAGNGTVTCTYIHSGVSYSKDTQVTVLGLQVTLDKAIACDGEAVGVTIQPIPAGVNAADVAACLTNLRVVARTAVASQGNPIGHTNLPIDPVNMASLRTTIRNAIWYSTQANHCNVVSNYLIKAVATCRCGGGNVESAEVNLSVSTSFGGPTCINGSATPGPPYFTGLPVIRTSYQWGIISPSGYVVQILPGTFRKNVNVAVVVQAAANSQYRTMIQNEENRHAQQFRGTTSIPVVAGMWNAANVINGANALVGNVVWSTEQRAYAMGVWAFSTALRRELARTNNSWNWNVRCALEREAKRDIRATHRATMPCAYPTCP